MELCNAAEMESTSSVPRDNITGNAQVNYCPGEPKEESSGSINIFLSDEKQTTKGTRNRFVTL